MTVPKAAVAHTLVMSRKEITLTDAPHVDKVHCVEVSFRPTTAVIEYHSYDDGPWELHDVRLYRVEGGNTTDLNHYGNHIDIMPDWLRDLVRKEMPRGQR